MSAPTTGTITLNRNQVVYDIDAISWKVARTRLTETRAQADAQSDSTSDNRFVLERRILTAVQKIKQECRWVVSASTGSLAGSDTMTDPQSSSTAIVYTFSVRDAISNKISGADVALRCHNYVVYSVLSDWFSYVMPSESATYAEKAATEMSELNGLFLRDAPAFPTSAS